MQSVQEVTDQRPSNAFQPEARMIDAKSFAELLTFDTGSRVYVAIRQPFLSPFPSFVTYFHFDCTFFFFSFFTFPPYD